MSATRVIRIRITDCEHEISFDADDINHVTTAWQASTHLANTLDELLEEQVNSEFQDTADVGKPVVAVRLDLAEMEWLTSAALNELINMNRDAKSRGLRFVLENPNDVLRSIFSLTRLERMFEFEPAGSAEVGAEK